MTVPRPPAVRPTGPGGTFRAMRLCLLAFALAVPATAQTAAAPPDSAGVLPYGRALTYRAILAETRLLRAVAPDTAVAPSDPVLGIGQLVVDETVSRTGSYFYDVFYRLWSPPADARFLSVVLSEQPLPGQGTLVSVRLDGELAFQGRLTPNEEAAETLARQAVVATLRRLPRG